MTKSKDLGKHKYRLKFIPAALDEWQELDGSIKEPLRKALKKRLDKTPVVNRPGQRQSISAASAVNAKGAFWFATYEGGLTGDLFVELLKRLMRRRKKPLHLVVDGLPAHKNAVVKKYVAGTEGSLTLHFLPGYAPDINPDELVWSHAKRTGVARRPLMKGEKLQNRVHEQLQKIGKTQGWCVRFLSILL